MRLYMIWQDYNTGYDTFDSAVVCAENKESARHIHPADHMDVYFKDGKWVSDYADGSGTFDYGTGSWCLPDKVKVEYLGEAAEGIEEGVVVSSFNAG